MGRKSDHSKLVSVLSYVVVEAYSVRPEGGDASDTSFYAVVH